MVVQDGFVFRTHQFDLFSAVIAMGVACVFSQSSAQVEVERQLSMGSAYFIKRDLNKAKSHLLKAILNDTTDVTKNYYGNLAYCYLELQNPDSALFIYKFGLKRYPDNSSLCYFYKNLLFLLDREQEDDQVECNIERKVIWWNKSIQPNLKDIPFQSQKQSQYLLSYISRMNKRYPTAKHAWKKISKKNSIGSKAWKEVYSLALFARMHNHTEYYNLYKAYQFDTDAMRYLQLHNVAQSLWRQ